MMPISELVKNSSYVRPTPKLPPTPVISFMIPRDRRATKGTTLNTATQAARAQGEKQTMAKMDNERDFAWPS